ncbi:NBR1-Ig-like domain-containing protein [Corallococcus terminator]
MLHLRNVLLTGLLLASLGRAEAAPHSERGGLQATALADTPSPTAATLEPYRSLVIVDEASMATITLRMVLDQLVSQAGNTGFTAEQLYRQLWDTQNPAPGQPDLPGGAHCTDNNNTLHGAPYVCRPNEGTEAIATLEPTLNRYSLVGLFNRFDLTPPDGSNCGEYRLVFARDSSSRNLVIFEAVLPNPKPELGLEGCRPIARTWEQFSTPQDPVIRRALVKSFFFDGPNPVIHFNNYGDNPASAGQVRTNQFMQSPPGEPSSVWMLREFKLKRECGLSRCTLRFVPTTVKANPRGEFFNIANTDPLAVSFRSHFLSQVASLAVDDINRFNHDVPDAFNAAQSDSQNLNVVDDYVAQFLSAPSNNSFANAIRVELQRIGSPLTPTQLVSRAQSLSCGGCHNRSSNADIGGTAGFFPEANPNFVHVSETWEFAPSIGEWVHHLSTALKSTFLPFRRQLLGAFLDTPALAATQISLDRVPYVSAGQPFSGSVTAKNTGTTSWTAANGLRAVSLDGLGDLVLDTRDAIHLGQQKSFSFTATAPPYAGRANFRWRMQRNGIPFGPELVFTANVKSPPLSCDSCAPGLDCPQSCAPPAEQQ